MSEAEIGFDFLLFNFKFTPINRNSARYKPGIRAGLCCIYKAHLPSAPFYESHSHRRSRLSISERTQPSIAPDIRKTLAFLRKASLLAFR